MEKKNNGYLGRFKGRMRFGKFKMGKTNFKR